jgi:hypothetical protein
MLGHVYKKFGTVIVEFNRRILISCRYLSPSKKKLKIVGHNSIYERKIMFFQGPIFRPLLFIYFYLTFEVFIVFFSIAHITRMERSCSEMDIFAAVSN